MRSGTLRQKVRIEARTRAPDGGGGFEQGWSTTQSGLKARIIDKSASESVVGDALKGISTHEIFLRLSSKTEGITNLMRVVDERTGAIYDVKGNPIKDERARVVKLLVQSGGRDG